MRRQILPFIFKTYRPVPDLRSGCAVGKSVLKPYCPVPDHRSGRTAGNSLLTSLRFVNAALLVRKGFAVDDHLIRLDLYANYTDFCFSRILVNRAARIYRITSWNALHSFQDYKDLISRAIPKPARDFYSRSFLSTDDRNHRTPHDSMPPRGEKTRLPDSDSGTVELKNTWQRSSVSPIIDTK